MRRRLIALAAALAIGSPALAAASEGGPLAEQRKLPLRLPSGHVPSSWKAITCRPALQRGTQPHTWGSVSPRGGAAPWVR